jgi:hypothetical protein
MRKHPCVLFQKELYKGISDCMSSKNTEIIKPGMKKARTFLLQRHAFGVRGASGRIPAGSHFTCRP